MTTKDIDYSKTVFLPKTSFSMKADLPKKEPRILEFWEQIGIYKKMLELRKENKPYILHDGPPYANGNIHIGHALNKILKDILVKSYAMMGHYTPFMPGWDCHGLPIEQNLLKDLKLGKGHIEDIGSFRKKAREFAGRFIQIQKQEFKRLGVFGDWENPYTTMSDDYEGTVIKAFRELFEKGYIYRDKKTIYWCISCETALADAEVEYKDKTSPSIYVKFKLGPDSVSHLGGKQDLSYFLVIWTTTPWTLPANMAAAVSKDEEYILLESPENKECYIVADKLADNFIQETGLNLAKGKKLDGNMLVGLKYEHCLNPSLSEEKKGLRGVISTDFVDMSTGTGIVHIAPGHGEEDFYAGKKLGLEIFCPVNEQGKFTKEAGIFEGIKVFEANGKIMETLLSTGNLIVSKSISHSYPHCWRCKNPVIFRATEQWFLGVDINNLREKLIADADKVRWVPEGGKERMVSMLKQRPDWCLSRQRFWGTPIPAVYCKSCDKLITDTTLIKKAEERVFKENSDFWFSEDVKKLVPDGYRCGCGSTEFVKEQDILDVWLDSGVSWYAVLKNKKIGKDFYPCDAYLEGSDQHRGWFQTSLIPSVALEGKPPYRTVLTHGFVLDDEGRAMHKSLGNVVAPQEVINKYGAEVLRLWVSLVEYSDDVRISEKLLSGPVDTYRKIRNTIKYLLGNLHGFDYEKHYQSHDKLPEMDRYIRCRLHELINEVTRAYLNFQYRTAIRAIADFCIIDLSSFYLDALKDRLYTFGENSVERRSAQTVLYDILNSVLCLTAPVLSFTAEETWQTVKKEINGKLGESVFLEDFPKPDPAWVDVAISKRWSKIMEIRTAVLKSLEEKRQSQEIRASLEAKVIFKTSDKQTYDFLSETLNLWPQVAIVSQSELKFDEHASKLDVEIKHADGTKCPRCWQWKTDVGKDMLHPGVCLRCAGVLKDM